MLWRLPGATDREAPGCWVSAESPSQAPPGPQQGLLANTTIPRCGQVGLPGRAKMGSSWGQGAERGPEGRIVSGPPCIVPTLRTEPRRGKRCWEGAAYPILFHAGTCALHPLLPPGGQQALGHSQAPLSQTGAKPRLQKNQVGAPAPCGFQEIPGGRSKPTNDPPRGFPGWAQCATTSRTPSRSLVGHWPEDPPPFGWKVSPALGLPDWDAGPDRGGRPVAARQEHLGRVTHLSAGAGSRGRPAGEPFCNGACRGPRRWPFV